MTRADVVRIIEEVERQLERLDHQLTHQNAIMIQQGQAEDAFLVRIPAAVEEKLRELRLALEHDEIFGADDEGWQ